MNKNHHLNNDYEDNIDMTGLRNTSTLKRTEADVKSKKNVTAKSYKIESPHNNKNLITKELNKSLNEILKADLEKGIPVERYDAIKGKSYLEYPGGKKVYET